jgi:hypothetical protein
MIVIIDKENAKYKPAALSQVADARFHIFHTKLRLYSQSKVMADAQKLTQWKAPNFQKEISAPKNLEYLLTVAVQQLLFKDLIRSTGHHEHVQ